MNLVIDKAEMATIDFYSFCKIDAEDNFPLPIAVGNCLLLLLMTCLP